MRQLLQPIVSKFDELLRLMSAEPDSNLQITYAACISHAMGFARCASNYRHHISNKRQNIRVTTCLENLKMSGNLKPVREMSGNLLTFRELSGNKHYHGKGHQTLVVASH